MENQLDIIFEATEDLFGTWNAECVMLKGAQKRIQAQKQRSIQSHCFEFCGLTGLAFNTLCFTKDTSGKQYIKLEQKFTTSCNIKVRHTEEFKTKNFRSLRPAYLSLLEEGIYSDLIIMTEEEQIPAHKCILMCRSPVFKTMLTSQIFLESSANKIFIQAEANQVKILLQWIYTGQTKLPDKIEDIIRMLNLAVQFQLQDLKQRIEEDIVAKLESTNILKILTQMHQLPVSNYLITEAKILFARELPMIIHNEPQFEQKISQVPGLMTELFQHFHSQSNPKIKRKVTFQLAEGVTVDTQDEVESSTNHSNSGYSSTASNFFQDILFNFSIIKYQLKMGQNCSCLRQYTSDDTQVEVEQIKKKSKQKKKIKLRFKNQNQSPIVAASKIQAVYRGYKARKQLKIPKLKPAALATEQKLGKFKFDECQGECIHFPGNLQPVQLENGSIYIGE